MGFLDSLFGGNAKNLNEEALKQTWHAANEMYAFNWAQTQDNYAYQQETLAANQLNEAALRSLREQTEFNGWQNRENMRLYEYSKEVEAYNAGVAYYEEQIDYNNIE